MAYLGKTSTARSVSENTYPCHEKFAEQRIDKWLTVSDAGWFLGLVDHVPNYRLTFLDDLLAARQGLNRSTAPSEYQVLDRAENGAILGLSLVVGFIVAAITFLLFLFLFTLLFHRSAFERVVAVTGLLLAPVAAYATVVQANAAVKEIK